LTKKGYDFREIELEVVVRRMYCTSYTPQAGENGEEKEEEDRIQKEKTMGGSGTDKFLA
jgi:hypothetical protein